MEETHPILTRGGKKNLRAKYHYDIGVEEILKPTEIDRVSI